MFIILMKYKLSIFCKVRHIHWREIVAVPSSNWNCMCLIGISLACNVMWFDDVKDKPIPLAEWSKARVCGRSLAGIEVSNPAGGIDACLFSVL
jgi:hypothetical protein